MADYNNKLVLGDGTVLIDLTQDTITADKLASGYTAHDASGARIVGTLQPGGESAALSDVNFYDCDGTIVQSYTASEFAALSALPANPSHDGLTAQGWNWSLADAKSYVASYGKLNVGQTYITDDGATRLHMSLDQNGRLTVPLYISQTVANGVTIDWGDGSAAETLSGAGNVNTTHSYASTGEYTISLTPQSGCTLGLGHGTADSANYSVFGGATAVATMPYIMKLVRVHIGRNVAAIGSYAFNYCIAARSITIPQGVTSIGERAFYYCYAARCIVIPSGVTSVGNYAFYYCYAAQGISFPASVAGIGTYAFNNCYAARSVTIPANVTSIGQQVFRYGYLIKELHVKPGSPPALGANAITDASSDRVIYVPSGSLSAYQSATNWSAYASSMAEE